MVLLFFAGTCFCEVRDCIWVRFVIANNNTKVRNIIELLDKVGQSFLHLITVVSRRAVYLCPWGVRQKGDAVGEFVSMDF